MKTQPIKPGPRYEAAIELLRAAEKLWNAGRIFLEGWNISPSQFNVLNLLVGRETGCTQTELSRQLIMHRSNVTGLIDRLEGRGLVRRRNSRTDRRAFNIVLTDAGKDLVRQIQPHYYRAMEAIWGGTPDPRAKQLSLEVGVVSANAMRVATEFSKPDRAAVSDQT